MRARADEVVLDAAEYVRRLPFSLEAVLGDRDLHARFLAAYPHVKSTDVPLVTVCRLPQHGPCMSMQQLVQTMWNSYADVFACASWCRVLPSGKDGAGDGYRV